MSGRHERLALARARSPRGQKPRAQTPAYLLYVNRPLGAWVARHAFAWQRTPDQLTAAGAAVAVVGLLAVLGAARWWWASLAGGLLLLLAYVLDSADGQLARLRGGGNPAGEWLDHVVDIAKTTAIHAVAVLVVLQHPASLPAAWVAVPLVFAVVSATSFFSLTLRDQLLARRPTGAVSPPFRLLRAFTGLPNDHAALCVVVATAAWPVLFVALDTVLCALSTGLLVRSLRHSHAALADGPPAVRLVPPLHDTGHLDEQAARLHAR